MSPTCAKSPSFNVLTSMSGIIAFKRSLKLLHSFGAMVCICSKGEIQTANCKVTSEAWGSHD